MPKNNLIFFKNQTDRYIFNFDSCFIYPLFILYEWIETSKINNVVQKLQFFTQSQFNNQKQKYDL